MLINCEKEKEKKEDNPFKNIPLTDSLHKSNKTDKTKQKQKINESI